MTTFGDKLKQARIEAALKQSELANILGTTNTTISNWEKGVSKPDLDTLALICGVLKKSPSYFLVSKLPEDDITYQEFELIKKYRSLDDYGKETINLALTRELERPALNTAHIIPTTSTTKDNMFTFSLDSHKLSTWDTSNISNMSYLFDSVTVLPPYSKLPRTLRKMLDESPDGLWTEAQLSKETSFHHGNTYTYSPLNAAHPRTDIEIEESVDTSENHIMDDKDF